MLVPRPYPNLANEKNHVFPKSQRFLHKAHRKRRHSLARTGLDRRGHGRGFDRLQPTSSLEPRSLNGPRPVLRQATRPAYGHRSNGTAGAGKRK